MEEAGQAHVEDFDRSSPVDQDVPRFDVAVNESRLIEGVIMCHPSRVHPPAALDDFLKARPIDEFHDQEVQRRSAGVVFVDVVSAHDVGVIESRDGARLALEPRQR